MRTTRKSGITALTAAIALSLGAVPMALTVPAIVASEEGSTTLTPATPPTGYALAGDLELATSLSVNNLATATATLTPASGSPKTETLTALNCAPVVVAAGQPDLLNITGQGKDAKGNIVSRNVGLLKGGFGVQDKGTGTSCGRVDSGFAETLTVAFGAAAVGTVGSAVMASSARLDLDLKGGAKVTATATGPGGSFVRTLLSGSGTDTATVKYCSAGVDAGPDSGANDNCDWTITPPAVAEGAVPNYFTSLTLVADTGSFALSGGSDYFSNPGAHRTRFELVEKVDGELNCDTKNTTVKRNASGTKPEVTVRRLATNADNSSTCLAVPYTLSNDVGTSGARFLKPLDQQTTAQFVADFVWTVTPTAGTTALPPTKVDFETASPTGEITIGWCPDPIYLDTIEIGGVVVPKLVGVENPLTNPLVTDMDPDQETGALAGKQFACVGVQQSVSVEDSGDTGFTPATSVKVIEQVYILGDIKLLR